MSRTMTMKNAFTSLVAGTVLVAGIAHAAIIDRRFRVL
jgi:hypothetical protein